MPKDALYEETAKAQNGARGAKLYTVFHVCGWILLVLAAIGFFVFFIRVLPYGLSARKSGEMTGAALAVNLLLFGGGPIMLGISSFLFFFFRLRFNPSYDYLFVEDELRITKVFNNRKRKHLITMTADRMLQIGYCEGDTFERMLESMRGDKPKSLTPNTTPEEGKQFIYILYSSSATGKGLYILECKKELLEYIVRAAGRNKFIKE